MSGRRDAWASAVVKTMMAKVAIAMSLRTDSVLSKVVEVTDRMEFRHSHHSGAAIPSGRNGRWIKRTFIRSIGSDSVRRFQRETAEIAGLDWRVPITVTRTVRDTHPTVGV